jgi:hypothetical protein
MRSNEAVQVRYWHKADIAVVSVNVRVRGKSGRETIAVRSLLMTRSRRSAVINEQVGCSALRHQDRGKSIEVKEELIRDPLPSSSSNRIAHSWAYLACDDRPCVHGTRSLPVVAIRRSSNFAL